VPQFLTIGYGTESDYRATDESVRAAAHAQDEALARRGAIIGIAGEPVQVRNHGGAGVRTEAGQFMTATLPVAGFALIEAADLDEAVALVAGTPCAVAYGVVEVWPLSPTPI
jgi:hypothetical protein